MPKNKAPGLDKITLKFIADCLPHIVQPITDIINSSLTQSIFPIVWKKAEVVPIPKADEAELASNNSPHFVAPDIIQDLRACCTSTVYILSNDQQTFINSSKW